MKKAELGTLSVGRIGFGAMGMSAYYAGAGDDERSIRTIHRALELGVTLIDTAEVYGPYKNEELVAKALKGRRDSVVLATKFGLIAHSKGDELGVDSSPESIRIAVEGSLTRLETDRIDLYYQHRVDPLVPIEETIGVLKELIDEGKVLNIGLSEAAPETIRRAHAVHPVTAIQTEYSLWTRDPESEILPLTRELGIGFVAYSPLGRGFLTGQIRSRDDLEDGDFRASNPRFVGENLEHNLRIVSEIEEVATELDATAAQVALAWVVSKGDNIVPIPGTTKSERVEENVGADALSLSERQIAQLEALPKTRGDRYADMSRIDR
jgi:aryl-alcohol dehydrogenase-like predicted oxidoreductase